MRGHAGELDTNEMNNKRLGAEPLRQTGKHEMQSDAPHVRYLKGGVVPPFVICWMMNKGGAHAA